jgi:hypothetical protein
LKRAPGPETNAFAQNLITLVEHDCTSTCLGHLPTIKQRDNSSFSNQLMVLANLGTTELLSVALLVLSEFDGMNNEWKDSN